LVGLAIGGIFLFADFEDPPVSDPVYGVVTTLTLP
jgi:hypothetical protein